jgi:hypothetical protein
VAAVAAEAFEILLHAAFRVGERGFSGGEDADAHGGSILAAQRRSIRFPACRQGGFHDDPARMKYLSLLPLLLVSCAFEDSSHDEAAHGRKMMGLLEKFDRFDYDGNGSLTRREIEQGVREAGVVGIEQPELDAMMKHYDVNKDGKITRWEAERVIDLPVPQAH